MKRKRYKLLITAAVAVALTALVLAHIYIPERIQCAMTVCTVDGETAELELDIVRYSSLLRGQYLAGTLTMDGVEYVDIYERFGDDGSKGRGFPTFVIDYPDPLKAFQNQIRFFFFDYNENGCRVIFNYVNDEIWAVEPNIDFYGPAENTEEAKQIADHFGLKLS